jgi:predicted permease
MAGLIDEIRFAARSLLKNPALSFVAVLTLGLGIGMSALMFSFVYGALYRGLPFPEGERVVYLHGTNTSDGIDRMGISIHDFTDLAAELKTVESLAAVYTGTVNVSGIDRPVRFDGAFMTANGLEALQVQPVLGRGFQEEEARPGGPKAILLSHSVWQGTFGSEPSILGRIIRVNGEPSTVVGVMPEGFGFPDVQEVWVPLRLNPLEMERGTGTSLMVYGRLAPEATLDQASAELDGVGTRLAEAYPESNEGVGFRVLEYTDALMGGEAEIVFLTMLATVILVFLVACTNVANLLLARAAGRTKELAVNVALGAHRARILGKLLAEALVLVVVGGLLGVALAQIGLEATVRLAHTSPPPFWIVFRIDTPVLLFVAAAAALAALVAGLIPGLRVTGSKVHEVLKDGSRGSSSLKIGRLSRSLVVAELALSVALLVSAGLMVKGMVQLRSVDMGAHRDEVFTARIGLFETDFPESGNRRQFFQELEGRLTERPEIRSAALTSAIPGLGTERAYVGIQGASYEEDQDFPRVHKGVVSPSFFETFGVEILSGRAFRSTDETGSLPVAIVNRSLAEQYFPGEDPVGRQMREGRSGSQEPWLTVVGVVPDLYMQRLGDHDTGPSGYYVPLAQEDRRFMSIVARGDGAPLSLTAAVQQETAALHADTPLYSVRTLIRALQEEIWYVDLFGGLFAVFGAIALFLAAAGLYAVMSTGVSRRTQEVGIRMALGARAGTILAMVLRQGGGQILLGLGLGLVLAAGLTVGLRAVLLGAEPWDATVFLGVSAILAAAGLLASVVPARRATRIDPVDALRNE